MLQPWPTPETRYASSDGVHIAYQTLGDGPIDLVFTMGWVTHLDYFWQEPRFARFLRRLASFARLILVDTRGTGLSDRAVGLPTLEERMDDIRAVMDAVGSRRAAIVGVSEGGSMSILFAATYPERTAALVLLGSAPRWLWAPDWPWSRTLAEIEGAEERIVQGWGTVAWAAQDLRRRAPSLADDHAFVRWWATYLRMGASPGAAIALNRMNVTIDNRHVLPAIRVPTLIVHASGDQIARVEAARYMAEHIPGATFLELPGDEHLPFVGDQDQILGPIQEFLGAGRPATEPDRVLGTVLAVRLADLPRLMAERGQHGWREAQRAYLAVVQRALELHRGRILMTSSDSVLATFDGPSRAVRCAQRIGADSAPLGIVPCAALHTGELDLVEGRPTGLALRVAAWIVSQARDGEILSSNTARDLVSGSGITFEDADVRAPSPSPGGTWRLFRVGSPPTGASQRAVIRSAPRRHHALTPREREVVGLLARGRTNREIADTLIISERTVENHVSNVLGKLGLDTRAQVAIWALRREHPDASASA